MKIFSGTSALALFAILGIVLIFFFPSASGPFSVTNGPATAFRSLAAAHAVFAAISAAMLLAVLRCVFRLQSVTQSAGQTKNDPAFVALRC